MSPAMAPSIVMLMLCNPARLDSQCDGTRDREGAKPALHVKSSEMRRDLEVGRLPDELELRIESRQGDLKGLSRLDLAIQKPKRTSHGELSRKTLDPEHVNAAAGQIEQAALGIHLRIAGQKGECELHKALLLSIRKPLSLLACL